MSAASVVPCPACGTKNRVPAVAAGAPRCAHCKAPLPWIADAEDATFVQVAEGPTPVLLDLWAPWCGPCRTVGPALEELARRYAGRVKLVKVNVDQAPATARRFGAQSIPLLLVLAGGTVVARQVGAAPARTLEVWLDQALGAAGRTS